MAIKIAMVATVLVDCIAIAMNLHLYLKEPVEQRTGSHLFFAVFLMVVAIGLMCKVTWL